MMAKINIVGYHPMGASTCLRKQEEGKTSPNAAQPDAKADGCVHDDLRADKLRKGWGFREYSWWRGSVVERRSLAGELSLSCA